MIGHPGRAPGEPNEGQIAFFSASYKVAVCAFEIFAFSIPFSTTLPHLPISRERSFRLDSGFLDDWPPLLDFGLGLAKRRVPFEVGKIATTMIWHPRSDRDAKQAWLRQQIREVYDSLQLKVGGSHQAIGSPTSCKIARSRRDMQ